MVYHGRVDHLSYFFGETLGWSLPDGNVVDVVIRKLAEPKLAAQAHLLAAQAHLPVKTKETLEAQAESTVYEVSLVKQVRILIRRNLTDFFKNRERVRAHSRVVDYETEKMR